jgi:hypothetical protein
VLNVNVQPQVQAQVQPQVGSAAQEDEEVEPVLATADGRDPVPAELTVLAGALGVSAAAFAAQLRARSAPAAQRR